MNRGLGRNLQPAVDSDGAGVAGIETATAKACKDADMIEQIAAELRLASFRSYLQATVDGMSALVPDILALAGADVAHAFEAMRPGQLWPRRLPVRRHGRAVADVNKCFGAGRSRSRFAPPIGSTGGTLGASEIIGERLIGPWIEARVNGPSLEAVLRCDGFELMTRSGIAYLTMFRPIPETAITYCRGRALEEVVDHPVLRGRGYVVKLAISSDDRIWFSFDVGRTAIMPPWAEGFV